MRGDPDLNMAIDPQPITKPIDAGQRLSDLACRELDQMRYQRNELLAALKAVLASARPSEADHSAMFAAWREGMRVIAKAEGR